MDIYQIILSVILTLVGLGVGVIIRQMNVMDKKFDDKYQSVEKRVDKVETAQAVDISEKKTLFKTIERIEQKLDNVLDPQFFQRCPNVNNHAK